MSSGDMKLWQRFKLEKGEWITIYPRGYKVSILPRTGKFNTPGVVEIDQEQADIVKEVFRCYSTGNYSLKNLTAYLENKYNIKFNTSHVARIIENKFYIGIMEWKGEFFAHNYPQLIDKETFKKCQIIKKTNTRYTFNGWKNK